MKSLLTNTVIICGLWSTAASASTMTLTEDFNSPGAQWRSNFMGTNSDLENYYVTLGQPSGTRGIAPTALFISDGDPVTPRVDINFDTDFGKSIKEISFKMNDFSSFTPQSLEFYDSAGNTISSELLKQSSDLALVNPVDVYSAISSNGIGGFSVLGANVEGFIVIDDIALLIDVAAVPIPAALPLFASALGAFAIARRSRTQQGNQPTHE